MARKAKTKKPSLKTPILSGREALAALREPTATRRRQWKDRETISKLPPPPPPAEAPDDEFTNMPATPAKAEVPATPAKSASSSLSVLDAAAQILTAADVPMNAGAIMEQMLAKGLWSTKGKTPAATLYSAMIREIASKGKESRFEKGDKGNFILRKS